MTDAAMSQPLSAADYLEWERGQLDKHEFHDGEVFAMAGGSLRHNFLSGAAFGELRAALRGKGCRTLTADQRISAKQGERYVYADAVAVCGEHQVEPGTTDVLANPSIVVEVLSPSTEAYDRGLKWTAYQRIPSLTDYLLITQASVRVEHFQRQAGHSWQYRLLEAGESITLSNGATIAVDALYEGAFDFPTT
jgi:Uma2 family endonuclease